MKVCKPAFTCTNGEIATDLGVVQARGVCMQSWPPSKVSLSPNKRVLFLTKDLELIRKQLYEGLDLRMEDLSVDDLLDDINTDVMTPAWVCFDHDPAILAENAYAGLLQEGRRVFESRALMDGGFEVIVSGHRKGTGSSRETAAQCERWSGIRIVIAASFAPIHERNNINLGQLMGDHAMLERLQNGESIDLEEFTGKYDPVTKLIVENGGIFPFAKKMKAGDVELPAVSSEPVPMTMAEKMISNKLLGQGVYADMSSPEMRCLRKSMADIHTNLLQLKFTISWLLNMATIIHYRIRLNLQSLKTICCMQPELQGSLDLRTRFRPYAIYKSLSRSTRECEIILQ